MSLRPTTKVNIGPPSIQFNPAFVAGENIEYLCAKGILHPECANIFRFDRDDKDNSGATAQTSKRFDRRKE